MVSVGEDAFELQSRRGETALRRPSATALRTYLLDADDDLAAQFDVRTRLAVRQGTTVRVVEASTGDCELEPLLEHVRSGLGLLVLDGLIAYDTRVGERTATELIGAGDLLQPLGDRGDAMLERTVDLFMEPSSEPLLPVRRAQ